MLQTSKKRTKPDFAPRQQIAKAKTEYRCPRCKRLLFKKTRNKQLLGRENIRYTSNPANDAINCDGMGRQAWIQNIEIKCPKCGKLVTF